MGFEINRNTVIKCDENDHEGLNIVAGWVREDLRKVFGDPDGEPSALCCGRKLSCAPGCQTRIQPGAPDAVDRLLFLTLQLHSILD